MIYFSTKRKNSSQKRNSENTSKIIRHLFYHITSKIEIIPHLLNLIETSSNRPLSTPTLKISPRPVQYTHWEAREKLEEKYRSSILPLREAREKMEEKHRNSALFFRFARRYEL